MRFYKYYGITHPCNLPDWMYKVWKRFFCKRNWHLFDEVLSSPGDEENFYPHFLSCDACNLIVNIHSIDDKYVEER